MTASDKAITIGNFITQLITLLPGKKESFSDDISCKRISMPELLKYGHFRGWLEDSDECHPDEMLNRQTAARIVHQFLRIEGSIPDLEDISPARKLKDLYTCRTCANHIAQVFTRGIMKAQLIEKNGIKDSEPYPIFIFNQLAPVSESEAGTIIRLITKIV